MKNWITGLIVGIGSVLITSCHDEPTKEVVSDSGDGIVSDTVNDLADLREFDMTQYDLDAIIFVPEKYYYDQELQADKFVQPIIEHNEGEALWRVSMPGEKYFQLEIEDWGPIEQSIILEKEQHLDKSAIYNYAYTLEGKDYMTYSRLLKSEHTTLSSEGLELLPNHHFFVVKQINGYYITVKSNPMQNYPLLSIKQMLNCARGLKSVSKEIL